MKELTEEQCSWHAWQKLSNKPLTHINGLCLGIPFALTDYQRIEIEPYIRAAGEDGAVVIVLTGPDKYTNWVTAQPIALTGPDRKSVERALRKAAKTNKPVIWP